MGLIHGAEATVSTITWMGRPAIQKQRVPKSYRHEILDARIRNDRTRDEARLLLTARQAGVDVPIVYDIDRGNATIIMEHIEGTALRDILLDASLDEAKSHLQHLGTLVAALHDHGLTHGDLTTSNVLLGERMVLIDFGLGQASREAEPRGVDLHLVEEALQATHAQYEELFDAFLAGYRQAAQADAALQRLESIRERGRYRGHG